VFQKTAMTFHGESINISRDFLAECIQISDSLVAFTLGFHNNMIREHGADILGSNRWKNLTEFQQLELFLLEYSDGRKQ
jgi:hypothetical protein